MFFLIIRTSSRDINIDLLHVINYYHFFVRIFVRITCWQTWNISAILCPFFNLFAIILVWMRDECSKVLKIMKKYEEMFCAKYDGLPWQHIFRWKADLKLYIRWVYVHVYFQRFLVTSYIKMKQWWSLTQSGSWCQILHRLVFLIICEIFSVFFFGVQI